MQKLFECELSSWKKLVACYRKTGRCMRTPENVQLVRAVVMQLPKHSTRKHAVALGMSVLLPSFNLLMSTSLKNDGNLSWFERNNKIRICDF